MCCQMTYLEKLPKFGKIKSGTAQVHKCPSFIPWELRCYCFMKSKQRKQIGTAEGHFHVRQEVQPCKTVIFFS